MFTMATIYNSNLTKELVEGGKLQVSRDIIPSQLAEKIVPVMEVNPKLLRRVEFVLGVDKNNTGSTTLLTIPANKEFYLTAAYICISKDVASDVTSMNMFGYVDSRGTPRRLAGISLQTLTATNSVSQFFNFNYPIRILEDTAISVSTTSTVGTYTAQIIIYGYFVDNIRA